jgi:hypothetical protein
MKKDTPLTVSGIVVAAVFGLSITGIIVGLIVMSVRARSKANRDEIRASMLSGSGGKSAMNDMESVPYKIGGGGTSDASLPLITPSRARSEQYSRPQQEYFSSRGAVSNSATSPGSNSQGVPPMPTIQLQLHQGLGALGQEGSAHWSEDYNTRR